MQLAVGAAKGVSFTSVPCREHAAGSCLSGGPGPATTMARTCHPLHPSPSHTRICW